MKINKTLIYSSLGMFLVSLLIACGGGKNNSEASMQRSRPKPVVTVDTVKAGNYRVSDPYSATLEAYSIVKLRSDVSGYLKSIKVEDGSQVHKGQVLYTLDNSRYQAAYNQTKANLAQVQATLDQKKRDLERYQDLLKHDAISRQTVDDANTAVKAAEANLAAAKASVDGAATDLDHTRIIAPMSGKLGIVDVKIGDLISMGQTAINTIVKEDPMYADFEIPQSDVGAFMHSEKNKSYRLQLSDGSFYEKPGKLVVVNNVVDQSTGSIRIRLQFPNNKGVLKSGMSAVVMLEHNSGPGSITIPTEALVHVLAETNVFVLDKDNKVASKDIETGATLGNRTLITKGLKVGDRVIVTGLKNLRPGMAVQIKSGSEKPAQQQAKADSEAGGQQ